MGDKGGEVSIPKYIMSTLATAFTVQYRHVLYAERCVASSEAPRNAPAITFWSHRDRGCSLSHICFLLFTLFQTTLLFPPDTLRMKMWCGIKRRRMELQNWTCFWNHCFRIVMRCNFSEENWFVLAVLEFIDDWRRLLFLAFFNGYGCRRLLLTLVYIKKRFLKISTAHCPCFAASCSHLRKSGQIQTFLIQLTFWVQSIRDAKLTSGLGSLGFKMTLRFDGAVNSAVGILSKIEYLSRMLLKMDVRSGLRVYVGIIFCYCFQLNRHVTEKDQSRISASTTLTASKDKCCRYQNRTRRYGQDVYMTSQINLYHEQAWVYCNGLRVHTPILPKMLAGYRIL